MIIIEETKWVLVPQGVVNSAEMICPNCNKWFALHNHLIENNGEVLGVVMCPLCDYANKYKLSNFPNKEDDSGDIKDSQNLLN